MKFYVCKHCGNVIEKLHDAGVPVICCGEPMVELTANTTDAAHEKHVPYVKLMTDTVYVQIGSVPHPMQDEHYIEWIVLETAWGCQRRNLKPGDAPLAEFTMTHGEVPLAVYAYCNIHGLWKLDNIEYGQMKEQDIGARYRDKAYREQWTQKAK